MYWTAEELLDLVVCLHQKTKWEKYNHLTDEEVQVDTRLQKDSHKNSKSHSWEVCPNNNQCYWKGNGHQGNREHIQKGNKMEKTGRIKALSLQLFLYS